MWNQEAPQGIEYTYRIDGVLNRHAVSGKREEHTVTCKDCHYVDDAVSVNATREEQVIVARAYQETTKRWGQEMSIAKTKSMTYGGVSESVEVEGGTLDGVEHFKYLGCILLVMEP